MTYRDIMRNILISALPSCGDLGTAIAKAAMRHPGKARLEIENDYAAVAVGTEMLEVVSEGPAKASLHLKCDDVTGAWYQTGVSFIGC